MTASNMSSRVKQAKRATLAKRHGNRCRHCGATGVLTLDHIVPIARGGTNALPNLQLLCLMCNQMKGDS